MNCLVLLGRVPQAKRSRSKSRSPSPSLTPTKGEESDGEVEMVSPRAAAEQGIDSVTNFVTENSSTIIIAFIMGTVSASRVQLPAACCSCR